jgi:hypothetical protein
MVFGIFKGHLTVRLATLRKSAIQMGIDLMGARSGALRQLVLECPPSVVAEALGYSYQAIDRQRPTGRLAMELLRRAANAGSARSHHPMSAMVLRPSSARVPPARVAHRMTLRVPRIWAHTSQKLGSRIHAGRRVAWSPRRERMRGFGIEPILVTTSDGRFFRCSSTPSLASDARKRLR